jgi:hypothetical protein
MYEQRRMGRPVPPLSALAFGSHGPPLSPDLSSISPNQVSLSAFPHSRADGLQLEGCGTDGFVVREHFCSPRKPCGVDPSKSQIDLPDSTFSTKVPPDLQRQLQIQKSEMR